MPDNCTIHLPPYTGPKTHCVKCGNDAASTEFAYPSGKEIGVEHLRRECSRCGYVWNEACQDANK